MSQGIIVSGVSTASRRTLQVVQASLFDDLIRSTEYAHLVDRMTIRPGRIVSWIIDPSSSKPML